MKQLRRVTTLFAVLTAPLCGACGGNDDAIVVFSASSLAEAFGAIEVAFETANPDLDVEVSVGGSSTLRLQVEQGAPADVIAVADDVVMSALRGDGLVHAPRIFASNSLVIGVPAANPGSVTSIADMADPDLLVGVCAPRVPCGAYAARVFELAGVDVAPDTEEPDVRSLTTKLAAEELDVGIVYATDVLARPNQLRAIDVPEEARVRATYPIAVLAGAADPDGAARFVEFVLSPEGQAILSAAGFGAP